MAYPESDIRAQLENDVIEIPVGIAYQLLVERGSKGSGRRFWRSLERGSGSERQTADFVGSGRELQETQGGPGTGSVGVLPM